MLRISENNASLEQVILLLEGQVSNHSVELAREVCAQALGQGRQLILDMTGVTFADRAGVALLREMQQRRVELINCSPFLKEQLKDAATF
ncbi:MAG TPA: STAS domain-containing protein [Blastocatellia bacterium]|nr:STAS domain-containing protein [Blastocatellia bacterium]